MRTIVDLPSEQWGALARICEEQKISRAEAVRIRKAFRIRLPDAIVGATARCEGCPLVTRNARDFPPAEPGIRIPYKIRVIGITPFHRAAREASQGLR